MVSHLMVTKSIMSWILVAGRHGDTQTNKPLNRDDRGLSKLLSRGDLDTDNLNIFKQRKNPSLSD